MEDMYLLGSEFAKASCLCFRNWMKIVLPHFGCASGTQVFRILAYFLVNCICPGNSEGRSLESQKLGIIWILKFYLIKAKVGMLETKYKAVWS